MSDLHRWVQLSPDTIAAMQRLSTPPPKPPMTDQHRATDEQWAEIEDSADAFGNYSSCLLELRDRIEALEAAQSARIDTSSLWQPAKNITPLNGDPSKRLPDPAPELGSLVERVQAACDKEALKYEAPAAIREVAEWLAQNGWGEAADVLMREASR
jgi:hypothetical protein